MYNIPDISKKGLMFIHAEGSEPLTSLYELLQLETTNTLPKEREIGSSGLSKSSSRLYNGDMVLSDFIQFAKFHVLTTGH